MCIRDRSWAVRFCAGLDNILTVLSGMSTKAQLDDNVSYMEHFEPLSDKEHEVLKTVVEKLNAIPTIPCTGCRYCVDDCPMQIHIPDIFRAVNHQKQFGSEEDVYKRQPIPSSRSFWSRTCFRSDPFIWSLFMKRKASSINRRKRSPIKEHSS